MFKVIYQPFPEGLEGVTSNDYSAIVYEGKRGTRVIVRTSTPNAQEKEYTDLCFPSAVFDLNHPPSFEFSKLLLGSIQDTWIWAERQRMQDKLPTSRGDLCRSRLDRPGRGGSGFDGYW